jgi:alpha,alpha-trehalase
VATIDSARAMVIIDAERFEALILDLDGVVTETASLHARAWKRLFDEFLARKAAQEGAAFTPFDLEADYQHYVDGKPRIAGLLSFLTARGVDLPMGTPGDDAEQVTIHGLAARKDRYFVELLAQEGIQAIAPTVALLQDARSRGMRLAGVLFLQRDAEDASAS